MKRRKAFARAERQQQVMNFMLANYERSEWSTLAEIALALDVTPSTKFREIVHGLVVQNALELTAVPQANIAGFRYEYRLSHDYLAYAGAPVASKKKGHELRINTRKGSFVEVLK